MILWVYNNHNLSVSISHSHNLLKRNSRKIKVNNIIFFDSSSCSIIGWSLSSSNGISSWSYPTFLLVFVTFFSNWQVERWVGTIRALLSDQVSIERQEGSIFDRSRGPHRATLREHFCITWEAPRREEFHGMPCLPAWVLRLWWNALVSQGFIEKWSEHIGGWQSLSFSGVSNNFVEILY